MFLIEHYGRRSPSVVGMKVNKCCHVLLLLRVQTLSTAPGNLLSFEITEALMLYSQPSLGFRSPWPLPPSSPISPR